MTANSYSDQDFECFPSFQLKPSMSKLHQQEENTQSHQTIPIKNHTHLLKNITEQINQDNRTEEKQEQTKKMDGFYLKGLEIGESEINPLSRCG